MRISKDPEVRRREIIDTAMKVFSQNGYEATSMTDIAKEINVVPGLCYRYFKSKQELYNTAVLIYAKEKHRIPQVYDACFYYFTFLLRAASDFFLRRTLGFS